MARKLTNIRERVATRRHFVRSCRSSHPSPSTAGLLHFFAALVPFALACATLHASDWPHLLGLTRDAVYVGPMIAEKWPAGRLTGSYPALADGFAYIKGPKQLACVDLRGNSSR